MTARLRAPYPYYGSKIGAATGLNVSDWPSASEGRA